MMSLHHHTCYSFNTIFFQSGGKHISYKVIIQLRGKKALSHAVLRTVYDRRKRKVPVEIKQCLLLTDTYDLRLRDRVHNKN